VYVCVSARVGACGYVCKCEIVPDVKNAGLFTGKSARAQLPCKLFALPVDYYELCDL
jgi:hypothetical protein